jgi:two-component system NtrC family response regulator
VLGSSVTRTVDVRVVAATNRDLPELAARGQFREDLLYRLNLIVLRLPALRERPGDVSPLARHFLARLGEAYGRPGAVLTDDAVAWLASRPWPGNVRQLEQTIERAVLVLDRDRLDASHLTRLSEFDEAGGEPGSDPGAMTLEQMERAMIEKALRRFDGNLTRAAEALGVSRTALYRRLQKHGLAPR